MFVTPGTPRVSVMAYVVMSITTHKHYHYFRCSCVKVSDFGFSQCFEPGTKLDTSCGSLCYSAPEILLGDSYDAPSVGACAFLSLRISHALLCPSAPALAMLACACACVRVCGLGPFNICSSKLTFKTYVFICLPYS